MNRIPSVVVQPFAGALSSTPRTVTELIGLGMAGVIIGLFGIETAMPRISTIPMLSQLL